MGLDLLDSVTSAVPDELTHRFAPVAGEVAPGSSRQLLERVVPVILAAMALRASSRRGTRELLASADEQRRRFGSIDRLGAVLDDPARRDLLLYSGRSAAGRLFGPRASSIGEAIARSNGLPVHAGPTLLAAGVPLVLSALGHLIATGALDAEGLALAFRDQRAHLLRASDAVLGQRLTDEVIVHEPEVASYATPMPPAPIEPLPRRRFTIEEPTVIPRRGSRGARGWLVAGVALIGLLALGTYNAHHSLRDRAIEPVADAPAVTAPASPTIELPRAPSIPPPAAPPVATGPSRLAARGGGPTSTAAHGAVRFERDSTEPIAPSRDVVDRFASALRAHPDARVRITGYADGSGGAEHDARLARMRADAVRSMLEQRGIGAGRIDAGASAGRPSGGQAELVLVAPR